MALGDLNRDGTLDVALADNDAEKLSVRLGNGDGTFGVARILGRRGIHAVALADLNHDGMLDVLAGRYPRSGVRGCSSATATGR